MTPDSSPDHEKEQPDKAPVRTNRGRGWWLWLRAISLIILIPVLALLLAAFLMIGRDISAPSWIVRDVEARMEEALAGGSLSFGDVKLTIGRDLHPYLSIHDAILRDKDGAIIAEVPKISGVVSPRGAVQGRALVQEIVVTGAQIELHRQRDGAVALAFDDRADSAQSADSFLGLLQQIDSNFETGPLEALERVRAEGLIINYSDARAGKSWTVDGGSLDLDLRGSGTELRGTVSLLSGRSYVTTAQMSYRREPDSGVSDLSINLTDASASDIASQAPVLSWLSVIDAPISGAMRGEVDSSGKLTSFSATLQIGKGQVQPNSETRPVPFDQAVTYLSYDPGNEEVTFDLIDIESSWGTLTARGKTYLQEFDGPWPAALIGQFQTSELVINPADIFPEPRAIDSALAEVRIRLNPFSVDIGQLVLTYDDTPVRMTGDVVAAPDGWSVGVEAKLDQAEMRPMLDIWPAEAIPLTRDWIDENVLAGTMRDVTYAIRAAPGEAANSALSMGFADTTLKTLPGQPPIEGGTGVISIVENRLYARLSEGYISAPQGGRIDAGGSTLVIPQTGPRADATFDLSFEGSITAAMSILAAEPFLVLAKSDLPVTLADGRVSGTVHLDTPLGQNVREEERRWTARADLRNVRSSVLVPGQTLSASRLDASADNNSFVVQGQAQLSGVGGRVLFSRALGPGSEGTERIEGTTELNQTFLDTFDIALPRGMVSGSGSAEFRIDLSNADRPAFQLSSDLNGIGLSLPAIGWSKSRGSRGRFEVEGRLGDTPAIDRLALDAGGLRTEGSISLTAAGGLQEARFNRVQLAGWLDAPVTLVGRGQGAAVGVRIAGGTLDLRRAEFGTGSGESGPMSVALDRLQISEGIALRNFRGEFTSRNGFSGDFTARLNGSAPISGVVLPVNGRSGVRIQSNDAGSVFRASGLLDNAYQGQMEMILTPAGSEGVYNGTMNATDVRVRNAPALASLLDAISVVGLLSQLGGQGLLFNEVSAEFQLTPSRVILARSSAIGPGLGLSMDGIYMLASSTMDFQGVISPFYILNGIGSIFTRRGEGLIGFNFNLQGSVDRPQVFVNPLSALTPGMFREIFRRPPPQISQ